MSHASPTNDPATRLTALRSDRRHDPLLWGSSLVLACLVIWAIVSLASDVPRLVQAMGERNVDRFFKELVPYPVRQSGSWLDLFPWARELMATHGVDAITGTFGIATLGIILAGVIAGIVAPFAASNLACPAPFGIHHGEPSRFRSFIWRMTRAISRGAFLLTRAIPEYIYAFLLLSIFGPSLWALILALAVHNIGILGRLGTEVIENFPVSQSASQLATGGRRSQAVVSVVFPSSLNRILVYFFYRWETCVREATVLGLVGIPSLGLLIDEARTRLYYDEMFFFVLLGASLVFAGDLVSNFVRSKLRSTQ